MKFTFKSSTLLLVAIFTLISCARDPKYKTAEVTQEESILLLEGKTFEVVLASTQPDNVSTAQDIYCDCKVTKVENKKCVKWERTAGEPGSYCIEEAPDGTYKTMMICARTCGQVNVYPSVIAISNQQGKISLLSKGLLIPEGMDLEQQYKDTELEDGSIVRTVLVKVTREKQLEPSANGTGTVLLVLQERA